MMLTTPDLQRSISEALGFSGAALLFSATGNQQQCGGKTDPNKCQKVLEENTSPSARKTTPGRHWIN